MTCYLLLGSGEIVESEVKNIFETPTTLEKRLIVAAGSNRAVVEAIKTLLWAEDEYYIGVNLNGMEEGAKKNSPKEA
jgi:hypothetical protein